MNLITSILRVNPAISGTFLYERVALALAGLLALLRWSLLRFGLSVWPWLGRGVAISGRSWCGWGFRTWRGCPPVGIGRWCGCIWRECGILRRRCRICGSRFRGLCPSWTLGDARQGWVQPLGLAWWFEPFDLYSFQTWGTKELDMACSCQLVGRPRSHRWACIFDHLLWRHRDMLPCKFHIQIASMNKPRCNRALFPFPSWPSSAWARTWGIHNVYTSPTRRTGTSSREDSRKTAHWTSTPCIISIPYSILDVCVTGQRYSNNYLWSWLLYHSHL